jgi:hypothetical protein
MTERERETSAPPAAGDRRLRDVAALLPVGFLLLILPPYIRVFDQPAALAGVPLLHLYVFGAWAAAIVAAGLVAHRLARRHMRPDGGDEGEPER